MPRRITSRLPRPRAKQNSLTCHTGGRLSSAPVRGERDMTGQSPLLATPEQVGALRELARSEIRGEADRARAILLTLSGWTSPQLAEAFGVTADSVRHWRQWFAQGGVEALRSTLAPGPSPEKARGRLRSPARCCASRSRTGATGRCHGYRRRSSVRRISASRSPGSASCCGKKGLR